MAEDNPELIPDIPSEDFAIEITESGNACHKKITLYSLLFILDLLQCEEDLHASFYPFPNKILALLYFLVHAPRRSERTAIVKKKTVSDCVTFVFLGRS